MNAERMFDRKRAERRYNRTELSPSMQEGVNKVRSEIQNNPEYQLREVDFVDTYEMSSVIADMQYVKRREKGFEKMNSDEMKETALVSQVFEAIVMTQSEMSEWLGSNVVTKQTTPYDDYKHGVDMVAEFVQEQNTNELLALAVDVSFGSKQIEKKFDAIKKRIEENDLCRIKYFESEDGDFKGRRRNIPLSVIGISRPQVEALTKLWVNGEKKILGNHPVQALILEQLQAQLIAMYQYAEKCENDTAVRVYRQALQTIKNVIAQKEEIDTSLIEDDPVHQEIMTRSLTMF